MRLHDYVVINESGDFSQSEMWSESNAEITQAIQSIVWPPGSDRFVIPPIKHGSGVVPIKEGFQVVLEGFGWATEVWISLVGDVRPGPVDAVKTLDDESRFLAEWETGNISSSHRSVNRMLSAIGSGFAVGGAIVVARYETLYPLLTDRIGNDRELMPYFDLWSSYPLRRGLLGMYVVDYDGVDAEVAPIPKGTDGRALV